MSASESLAGADREPVSASTSSPTPSPSPPSRSTSTAPANGSKPAASGSVTPSPGQIHDQAVILPRYQVIVVFLTLTLVIMSATLDQTCIATAMPQIADDLGAGASITWVGTAFLVTSTTTQVISSRLSDIFGRKSCLLVSVAVFSLGNLFSGFARNEAWLYAGRGLAGLGAGGINSLALIVISDVVSLRDRGMYISLMGIPVALGLGFGPLLGGLLAQHASWRWSIWISVPLSVGSMPVVWYLLPLKSVPGSVTEKLRTVDWGGCVLSLVGIVLLLVPVSAGGSSWAWNSPESIAMFVVGGVVAVLFVVTEMRHPLPILPMRLFANRTVAFVLAALFCAGVLWHGLQFVAPLYLQNVLSYAPVTAGAILLPFLVGQVVVMTGLGYLMKRTGKVKLLILTGYLIWTAGQGVQVAWTEHKDLGLLLGTMTILGVGFGLTSQSTLVLAQAACDPADRAVITGARNLFRTSGGAVGLAIANAIMNGLFASHLPNDLPADVKASLLRDGFSRPPGLTDSQTRDIVHAYFTGLRYVFVMYVPVAAACFLFCLGAEDVKLDAGPRPQPNTGQQGEVEMDRLGSSVSDAPVETQSETQNGEARDGKGEVLRPKKKQDSTTGILTTQEDAASDAHVKLPDPVHFPVEAASTATSRALARKSSRRRVSQKPDDEL